MSNNKTQEQLNSIFEAIIGIAQQDNSKNAIITDGNTQLDAIASGVNMLSEQIEYLLKEKNKIEEDSNSLNRQLSLAVRAGGVGIWRWDIINNHLIWDEQMYKLYGITPDTFGGAYNSWRECVHPDDLEHNENALEDVIQNQKEFYIEFRVIWPDSSIHYMQGNGDVIRDESGKAIALVGTNWDITQFKTSEHQLRESEERFRLSSEISNNVIWEWDIAKNSLAWFGESEKKAAFSMGNLPATMEAKNRLIHPDDIKKVEKALKNHLSEGVPYEEEYRVIDVSGKVHYWIDRGKMTLDEKGNSFKMIGTVSDITERKEFLFELMKFREAIDSSAESIYIIERESMMFVDCNASASNSLGYAKEELLKMGPEDIKPKLSRNELAKHFDEVIQTGKAGKLQTVHSRKDGSLYDVEVYTHAFRYDESIYLTASVRDITERLKTEQKLLKTEERLQILFSSQSTIIYSCQAEAPYGATYVSENIKEYTGYTSEDLIGNPDFWLDNVHPDDREKILSELPKLFEEGTHKHEYRWRFKNGEYRWMLDKMKLICDAEGKPKEIIGNYLDITNRKRIENEVLEMKIALQNQSDAISRSNAIIEFDPNGNIVSANKNFLDLFGYSLNEIKGKKHSIFLKEEQTNRENDYFWNKLRHGVYYHDEFERKGKDGQTIWIMGSYNPIFNSQGQVESILKIVTDISTRKKAERNAQYRSKELESFSYSVSHDLRAPLRAINGYAQILQEEYGTQLNKEANRLINNIINSAKKMGQLIDDLLDFSHIGRKEMRKNNIRMHNMVVEVMEELKTIQSRQDVEFHIDQLQPISADKIAIKQVWANLISNAIKYSGQKEKPVIEIGSQVKGKEVIYYVKDNGAGFDMQYADKLFGVFQRLHSNEEFEGTGVGLAIVQRIINKHGGRVWAEGKIGEGATFSFSLPEN